MQMLFVFLASLAYELSSFFTKAVSEGLEFGSFGVYDSTAD